MRSDWIALGLRCIEKDNFLMKIAENRKLYGDMEHIARAGAAKKSKPKARTAKGAGMGAPQGMGAKSGSCHDTVPMCTYQWFTST
eukprot:m.942785 g.942785  ORF g.942785 m.942785 type:complete len:85 (-) comp23838_c0_seq49:2823-3077(-)